MYLFPVIKDFDGGHVIILLGVSILLNPVIQTETTNLKVIKGFSFRNSGSYSRLNGYPESKVILVLTDGVWTENLKGESGDYRLHVTPLEVNRYLSEGFVFRTCTVNFQGPLTKG